ncbi:MAG: DNA alkylation repair protein [Bacteroidales bacterium]|nr:DNA alkylation repair protein [Bacteroidales bacterium]
MLFSPSELNELLGILWQQPQREFQYVGIDFAERLLKKLGEEAISTIEFMITQKSWWDTVDWVASHHAGTYFQLFPQHVATKTESWACSDNMWLQRSALLFQLKYKAQTDEALLFDYITRLKSSKAFFIRKAIGWSLREYSKTSPERVIRFLEKNNDLAGLSRREALKWIERKNKKTQHG